MIVLKNPLDMHIHLREGDILKSVVGFSAKYFSGALAMPNLNTPLVDVDKVLKYKSEILNATSSENDFMPIMSLYITENLSREELIKAKKADIKILKLYPKGSTTGSQNGVKEILSKNILEIFSVAQELGLILSIHGETNGFSMDREFEFKEIFEEIAINFPNLKIIIEHISDRRSIELIHKHNNVFATITLHHMIMTLDDVIGNGINPHYFCKPILKTPKDRDAILELALSADKKVSFGSDSAPHLESMKLKTNGCAGIFSAPVLLPMLCEIFEKHNKLDNLQKFVSDNAVSIYQLKDIPRKDIKLIKKINKINNVDVGSNKIIPMFNKLSFLIQE